MASEEKRQIRAVFFDLGGTLRIAEEIPEYQMAARDRMAELAGYEDPETFIDMVEERYKGYRKWAMGESREAGDYELWKKWLLPELPDEKLREICHEITYEYRQYNGKRHVVEGGVEVIRELKRRGYQLGIISNLIGENEIGDWLKADGLDSYFDSVILSSVTHIRKPDPRMYQLCCEEMGVTPAECVNVADNLKRDFTGPKELGIGANVMYIDPEKLGVRHLTPENMPDYLIFHFRDLLTLPMLQGVSEGA